MKLAINGGSPVRAELLPNQKTWGEDEAEAALRVVEGDCLTGYQGNHSVAFYGGPEVRNLESEFVTQFASFGEPCYAIAVNSATSGLVVACGAAGIEPEDEVIVTPYSMTCSATAPMAWGGFPVFADIESFHFCLDPDSVRRAVTSKTKAILVVDLFGQPFDYPEIRQIADDNHLMIIEDAAQAIGSQWGSTFSGTLGDVGVFSFNQGKHMTSGEGGMILTRDKELAFRCRLLMNHAEAVVNDMEIQTASYGKNFSSMFGFNLRLPEVSAAIAWVQLHKLQGWIEDRQANCAYIQEGLRAIPPLESPPVRKGCTHTYYCLPFLWRKEMASGIPRDTFVKAVRAELAPCEGREQEGVPIRGGYIRPISSMPLFRHGEELVPVCSRVQNEELILIHRLIGPMADRRSLDDVIEAFHKVWENRRELK